MRPLLIIAGKLATVYVLVVLALFFLQRSMIYPAPSVPAVLPAGFTQVDLNTEDGLTLKAAFLPPGEGKPTAVYFYGNADSWAGASAATAVLAARGYGVLLPDYRGYSGNPGKPHEQGLYHDGRAALRFLEQQGTERRDIILIGNSLGSGVATQLAAEGDARALVLISPYTSLPGVAKERFFWLPVDLLLRDRFDNLEKITEITAPLLVIHGERDDMIGFSHGQALAEASDNGTLISFAEAGHELAYTGVAQEAAVAWLERLDNGQAVDLKQ